MMATIDQNRRHFISLIYICLFTLVCHGWLLLNKSFFWDDWIWVLNPDELRIAVDELGFVFFKDLFYAYFLLPLFYQKLIVFSCFLLSSIILYFILNLFSHVDRSKALFVTILFTALPFNIVGRSTLCTAINSLSFLFFTAAFYFYAHVSLRSFSLLKLFLAFLFFTISFNTNSFLVLYVAGVFCFELYLFMIMKKNIKHSLLAFSVALVHAISFYIIKKIFFPSTGVYYNYNQINFNIDSFLSFFIKDSYHYIFEPLFFSVIGKTLLHDLQGVSKFVFPLIFIFPVAVALIKRRRDLLLMSIIAILMVWASTFAYDVVGKAPFTFGWDSRHQLLLPFGSLIWILSFGLSIKYLFKVKSGFKWLLVFFLIFGTARLYLGVQGLRYQDLSLQYNLKNLIPAEGKGSYVLSSSGSPPGVMEGEWNFYELTGMLYQAHGTQTNAIILLSHVGGFANPEHKFFTSLAKRYMLHGAVWLPPFKCVNLIQNRKLNEFEILELLYSEYLSSHKEWREEVDSIYTLTISEGMCSLR